MEGVAIIIPWDASLSRHEIEDICNPLYPEKIGSMPIFNADSIEEFNLILNTYQPGSLIIAHPFLENLLGWYHANYSINVKATLFSDVKVLSLPSIVDWEWHKLIAILDRLEEIL